MIKNIIILLLILLIIFNLFKPKKENFTDTTVLEDNITNFYADNIKYINNILDYVNNYNINNNNINIKSSTPINCNNMTVNGLYTSGSNKFNNLIINGNLTISDNLIIDDYRNDSYTKDINIIPRYTIIAWYDKYCVKNDIVTPINIPKGWVLCDGKSYFINNGVVTEYDISKEYIYTGQLITTPNLVDRFVIGQSKNISEWTSADTKETYKNIIIPFNSYGGNNFHTLTLEELPTHFHLYYNNNKLNDNYNIDLNTNYEKDNILNLLKQQYGDRLVVNKVWQSDGSYKLNLLIDNVLQDKIPNLTSNNPNERIMVNIWNNIANSIDLSKKIYLNGLMSGYWNVGGGDKTYTYTDNEGGVKNPESFDVRPPYINLYYIMKI